MKMDNNKKYLTIDNINFLEKELKNDEDTLRKQINLRRKNINELILQYTKENFIGKCFKYGDYYNKVKDIIAQDYGLCLICLSVNPSDKYIDIDSEFHFNMKLLDDFNQITEQEFIEKFEEVNNEYTKIINEFKNKHNIVDNN
jgi:hypothetical protein